MYIPVSHINGPSIPNMIGVVIHRLVGMGLKDRVGRSGRVLPGTHLNGDISLDI